METIVLDQGMLVSGIILAASFILIFTETLHGFHRVKVAMAGAAVMLVVGQSYGFYSPEAAFEAVDWNVVFLLGSMMAVVAIMINSGGFEVLAANRKDSQRQAIHAPGPTWNGCNGNIIIT